MLHLEAHHFNAVVIESRYDLLTPAKKLEHCFETARQSRPANAKEALLRLDSSQKALQQIALLPEKQAGKKIWSQAQDYTKSNNLEDSLQEFLKSSLGSEEPLTCINPSRILECESVFVSHNYAVKVFPVHEECFYKIARELSGMEALKDLPFQHGKPAPFLALGKCRVDERSYFLLAMPKAQGKTIKKYLDQFFIDRDEESLLRCKKALRALGLFLAELHQVKAEKKEGLREVLGITFEKIKGEIEKAKLEYEERGGVDPDAINKRFEKLLNDYDSSVFYFTLFHDDAHLENFLYDENSAITVIDTPRIHTTTSPDGEPLFSSYAHDLARAKDDIRKWVLYQEFNPKLIEELIEEFHTSYCMAAKELYIPSQFALDEALTMLSRLKSVLKEEKDPLIKAQKERIFHYYTQFFRED